MSVEQTELFVQPTEYLVSAVPPRVDSWYVWALKVVWRGEDRWAVTDGFRQCLSVSGEWDWESIPSERTDEWIAEHRFDLDTALERARELAPLRKVNGFTPAQAIARWGGVDGA